MIILIYFGVPSSETIMCWNMVQEWGDARRALSACENMPTNKTRVLWLQFLQNMELFLESVFILLPGVADKSEFISDYSSLLPIIIQFKLSFIYLYDGKTCFSMRGLSLWPNISLNSWELYLCALNSHSIGCLRLWISWLLHENLVHIIYWLYSLRSHHL